MALPPRTNPPKLAPPQARNRLTVASPVPSAEGFMSNDAKMSLANIALALRDEQLEARVVHYKADLATNSELDAITAQVIQELEQLRASVRGQMVEPKGDRTQIEAELVNSFETMLARIFKANRLASVLDRKLPEVSKRFARIFFESELHSKIRGEGDQPKVMRHPEQALYHLFAISEDFLLASLESFDYATPDVLERAEQTLAKYVRELRNEFLARTTPELNTLVAYLNDTLTKFFTQALPPDLRSLSEQVIRDLNLDDSERVAGYKIPVAAFGRFRQTFERRFLERLVPYVEEEMLSKVRGSAAAFRDETLRFVADPQIFTDTCEVVCDPLYDLLYNEGFLDLPNDWRTRLKLSK